MRHTAIHFVIITTCLFLQVEVRGQNGSTSTSDSVIHFQQLSTWDEIKNSAHSRNKYIFIDCYASWCGPCKAMDETTYHNDTVRRFTDDNFISVKIQMDSTRSDDDYKKKSYALANVVMTKYNVLEYPTYLFLDSNGNLLYREVGYKAPVEFLTIERQATDSSTQLFLLLSNYRKGLKPDYKTLGSLAKKAKNIGDLKLASEIATDYKHNYLDHLSDAEICNVPDLLLMNDFPELATTEDNFYNLYKNKSAQIDSLMGRGWSDFHISYLATRDSINAKLYFNEKPITKNPDWSKIERGVVKRFGKSYVKLIGIAKLNFYQQCKNWPAYANTVDELFKANPPKENGTRFRNSIGGIALFGEDSWALNVVSWNLFQGAPNRSLLLKALSWSELSININHVEPPGYFQYLDTKANILFALKRYNEAIRIETKAVELAPFDEAVQTTLAKMKRLKAASVN